MKARKDILEFEWDSGNLDKNYLKHGVSPSQAEELFVDEDLIVVSDVKHSQNEPRYIAVGKDFGKRFIFVVFTIRKKKIRVISARKMHRKEVDKYEEIKKNPSL